MLYELAGFHTGTELERKMIAHSESQVLSISGFVFDTPQTVATRPTGVDRSSRSQPSAESLLDLADEKSRH